MRQQFSPPLPRGAGWQGGGVCVWQVRPAQSTKFTDFEADCARVAKLREMQTREEPPPPPITWSDIRPTRVPPPPHSAACRPPPRTQPRTQTEQTHTQIYAQQLVRRLSARTHTDSAIFFPPHIFGVEPLPLSKLIAVANYLLNITSPSCVCVCVCVCLSVSPFHPAPPLHTHVGGALPAEDSGCQD